MELDGLTMEQAKAIYKSDKGQASWQLIARMAGPPVEYAFREQYIMRLVLAGAFGGMLIYRNKEAAEQGLAYLKEGCVTDYDKAVWALAAGTFPEVFGNREDAIPFYREAITHHPGTYVAYLRLAKIAYDAEDFETAEAHCRQGLSYLREDQLYGEEILKAIEVQFMGFLQEIFKKRKEKQQPKAPQGKTLEEIWAMEDPSDFVIAMSQYIGSKCRYGEKMSALSGPERVFYVGQLLEMEVNNGGFSQFFFNSSGDFANELVSVFTEIGAVKTAEICKKAVSVFGESVPTDRNSREDQLLDNEELEAFLEECDDGFLAYEEDLNGCNYEYVMKNKAAFS